MASLLPEGVGIASGGGLELRELFVGRALVKIADGEKKAGRQEAVAFRT